MSKSVDTRVVEMKFDNKQFENGAKNTISTLSKLKEALKFGDASKSLGKLNVSSTQTSLNGLVAGVESLNNKFSALGIVGMRVIQNITDGLMNKLNSAVHVVTDSIISGGVKRAMNIENAHFQLQSLLKDETKVQAVMADAMEAVDGTAYAYDEAAKAASMFSASGIQAGDDMLNALKGITGVAAMTNSSFEDISMIFTTVAGQGRLMGDQLNQFAARGLNAASTVADYLMEIGEAANITEADVRKMVSHGEIDFKTFADAMTWAFGDSAKRANETFTGSLSNIKSALARIGAGFISPLVEQNGELVKMFNALRIKINDVKSALVFDEQRSAVAGLAEVTKLSTDELNGMFKSIKSNGSVSISDLDTLTQRGANATDALVKYFNGVNDGSIRSTYAISQLVDSLTEGTEVSSEDIRRFVEEGRIDLGTFTAAMEHAFGIENNLSKQFTDSVLDMVAKITNALNSLDMTKPMEIFYYWVETVKNVIKGLGSILKPIGKAFADVFLSFDIDQVLSFSKAIEDLTSRFKLSEKGSKNLELAFKGVFSVIKLLIDGAALLVTSIFKIKNPLDGSIDGFLGLAGAMGNALISFTEFIRKSPVMELAFDALVALINKAVDAIGKFVSNFGNFISEFAKSEKIANIVDNLKDKIVSLGEKAVPKLQNFIDSLRGINKVDVDFSFGKIIENIKKMISSITDFDAIKPGEVFEKFKEQMMKLLDLIPMTDGLRTFVENVKKYLNELSEAFTLENLYQKIDHLKNKIAEFFEGLSFGKILGAGGGFGALYVLYEAIKKFGPLADTLKKVTSVMDEFKGVLKAYQKEILSEALLNIAKAIGWLAGSLTLLSFADQENLQSSATVLVTVAGLLMLASEKLLLAFGKLGTAFERLTAIGGMYVFSKTLKKIVDSIAEVALTIVGLGLMWREDPEAFDHATKLVAGIGGVLIAIGGLAGLAAKHLGAETTASISKIGFAMLGISTSLGLVTLSLGKLMDMKIPEDYKLKLGILTGVIGELGVLALAMGGTARLAEGYDMPKIGGAIKSLVLMLVGVVLSLDKLMSIKMPEDYKLKLGILAGIFGGLETVVLALGGAARISGGFNLKAAGNIVSLTYMMKKIVDVLGDLFKMTLPSDYKAKLLIMAGIFGGLETVIIALGKAARVSGGNSLKAAGTIIALCGLLSTISGSLAFLSNYDFDDILKGVYGLAGVLSAVALVMNTIGKMKKASHAKELFATTSVLIGITGSLTFLAFVSWEDMIKGVGALGTVLYILSKDFEAIGKMKVKKNTLIALGEFIGILVVIAGSLFILAQQPWENMAAAGFAMGSCLLAMTKAFEVVMEHEYSPDDVKKAGVFLELSLAIVPIAAAIYELANQPWESLLAAGGSISAVLLSLTAAYDVVIKSQYGPDSVKKAGVFLELSLAVIPIAAAISELAQHPWQSLLAAAGVIDSTLVILTGTLIALSKTAINKAVIAEIATATLEVLGIAGSIALLAQYDPAALYAACIALDSTLVVLTGSMIALGTFSGAASGAIAGVAAMGVVIGELGAIFTALGALKQIPNLMWFIEEGGELLKTLGRNIGETIGAIVGGAIAEIASRLPEIGANLTSFMTNLGGFIEGSKSIDNAALAGVGILAGIIIALTAAEVINGIAKLFGLKMEDMAVELSSFMVALKPFIDNSKDLNPSSVKACESLASMIIKLTVAEVIAGVGRFLGISGSLKEFGEELASFGPSIKQFADTVKDVNPSSVQGAASAAEIMAEMNKKLPASDGLVQKILGSKSLATFAEELTKFGPAIKQFATSVEGVNASSVQGAAAAAEIMSEMGNKLPDQGGIAQKILGSKSLSNLAEELNKFGPSIKTFANTVNGINPSSVQGAASAAEIMAVTSEKLPDGKNVFQKLFGGGSSLGSFSAELITFGGNMKKFSDRVSGINSKDIDSAVKGFKKIAELSNTLSGGDSGKGLSNFTKNLAKIGTDSVDKFVNAFKESGSKVSDAVSSFSTAIENGLNTLKTSTSDRGKEIGEGIIHSMSDGMNNIREGFLTTIGTIGSSIMAKLNETINEEEYFNKGRNMITSLLDGFNSNAEALVSATGATLVSVGNTVQNTLSPETFSEVGTKISSNIANGITSTVDVAVNAGTAASNNIKSVFSDALSEVSMTPIGSGVTTAISNGISSVQSQVSASATNVANVVKTNISETLNTSNMTQIGANATSWISHGIDNNVNKVRSSSSNMANGVLTSIKNTLAQGAFTPIGSNIPTYIGTGISNATNTTITSAQNMATSTVNKSKEILNQNTFTSLGQNVSQWTGTGITNAKNTVTNAAQNVADSTVKISQNVLNSNTFQAIGTTVSNGIGTGINSAAGNVTSAMSTLTNNTVSTASTGLSASVGMPIGTGFGTSIGTGINNTMYMVSNAASTLANNAKNAVSSAWANVQALGEQFCSGITNGVNKLAGSVASAFTSMANKAYQAAASALDIHSPSKKAEYLGEEFGAGMVNGINVATPSVVKAANVMANKALKELQETLDIHSPSKKTKGLGENLAIGIKTGLSVQGVKVSDNPNDSWYNNGNAYQNASDDLKWAVSQKEQYNNGLGRYEGVTKEETSKLKSLTDAVAKEQAQLSRLASKNKSPKNNIASVSGLAKRAKEIRSALSKIGSKNSGGGSGRTGSLVSGILSSLKAGYSAAVNAAKKTASAVKSTTKSSLKTKSPSREGMKIGEFWTEGLAVGMIDGIHFIQDAAEKTKEELSYDFSDQNIYGDLNTDPVIKPIIDLSDVEQGAKDINNLMSKTYDLSAVIDGVNSASSSFGRKDADNDKKKSSNEFQQKEGATFNFTQNNYSPQALSRYEIYRQTNNQFNAFRLAVTNS